MKKMILLYAAALSLSCLTAFPSSAAAKDEYQAESAEIRSSCKDIKAETDTLRTENKTILKRYKALLDSIGSSSELPASVTQEDWDQIKELRRQIREIQADSGIDRTENTKAYRAPDDDDTGEDDALDDAADGKKKNSAVKAAVQKDDFDTALNILKEHLSRREDILNKVREKNELWKQIDALMN